MMNRKHNEGWLDKAYTDVWPTFGAVPVDWSQLSRYHFTTETEYSLRKVIFYIKCGTIDNVQNCVSDINIPLSQIYS
jgi:hypothetical protein